MKFRVLSIDAWGECTEGCEEDCNCNAWSWNNWRFIEYYVENLHGELTEENAETYFRSLFHGSLEDFKSKFEIEDDQYNLVLVDKKDRRPLYAIEFGNTI